MKKIKKFLNKTTTFLTEFVFFNFISPYFLGIDDRPEFRFYIPDTFKKPKKVPVKTKDDYIYNLLMDEEGREKLAKMMAQASKSKNHVNNSHL